MSLIVVEAIRGRCASFMVLTATVLEIFGGQTNSSISVVSINKSSNHSKVAVVDSYLYSVVVISMFFCSLFECDPRECEHIIVQRLHRGTGRYTRAEDGETHGEILRYTFRVPSSLVMSKGLFKVKI